MFRTLILHNPGTVQRKVGIRTLARNPRIAHGFAQTSSIHRANQEYLVCWFVQAKAQRLIVPIIMAHLFCRKQRYF